MQGKIKYLKQVGWKMKYASRLYMESSVGVSFFVFCIVKIKKKKFFKCSLNKSIHTVYNGWETQEKLLNDRFRVFLYRIAQ